MSRAPLISSAVAFLRDPSTANSPLAKRIQFLEAKGLTPQEIEQAFTASNSYQSPPNYNGNSSMNGGSYPMRREFERDWRDWFIMGVVGGAVGFVAVKLAQKFLLPHLQPPSETELQAAQTALEAKYDEATSLLLSLQTSTDSLAKSLEEQKLEVEKDLIEVRKAVEEMKEGEKRREEWSKKIGEQVDGVVKGLPSMLEKQSASQIQSLTDLQTELKSLKSLLVARRPLSTGAPVTSTSTLPAASTSTTPTYAAAATTLTEAPAPTASGSISGRTSSFGIRSPSIPAWQMQSNSRSLASGSNTPVAGTSMAISTPAVEKSEDTGASGVLVNKEDASVVEEVKAGGSSEVVGATTEGTST